jgi:uncharacterized protein YpmS
MEICAAGAWKRSAILELLQLNSTGAATLCFVSLLHWQKKEKKGNDKKKERERKKIGEKEKNRLSNFLEIVIDNLYLLYYYRVIKIEDVNYIMK